MRAAHERGDVNVARAVAAVTGTVTAAAMIATPLVAARWRASAAPCRRSWSWRWLPPRRPTRPRGGVRRARLTALGAVVATTTVVERIGTATGVPFGRYEYTDALRPQIGRRAGDRAAGLVRHGGSRPRGGPRGAGRTVVGAGVAVVVGAAALTAWDLFLDPQMVGEGYWRWTRPARTAASRSTNFVGWFVTGLGVMPILERTCRSPIPSMRRRRRTGAGTRCSSATYALMAADGDGRVRPVLPRPGRRHDRRHRQCFRSPSRRSARRTRTATT